MCANARGLILFFRIFKLACRFVSSLNDQASSHRPPNASRYFPQTQITLLCWWFTISMWWCIYLSLSLSVSAECIQAFSTSFTSSNLKLCGQFIAERKCMRTTDLERMYTYPFLWRIVLNVWSVQKLTVNALAFSLKACAARGIFRTVEKPLAVKTLKLNYFLCYSIRHSVQMRKRCD